MMKPIIIAAVFFSLGLACSCNHTKESSGDSNTEKEISKDILFTRNWKLAALNGESVADSSKAIVTFTTTGGNIVKMSGSTGCNWINTLIEFSNGNQAKKMGNVSSTRMACVDETSGRTENLFIAALNEITGWTLENGNLIFKSHEIPRLKFVAQDKSLPIQPPLNGTWELNYISGPKIAFNGLFPRKKPTLIFNLPGETATGNGSCNSYSVKIKVEGNQIQFGDALSTMMACEGNGEPLYFKTLKSINAFTITDTTLVLLMDDVALMKFTKK